MPLAPPSSLGADTASVFPSPLNARRTPNQSSIPEFEALNDACWDHVAPERTNTYAAPTEISSSVPILPEWPVSTVLMPVVRLSSSGAPAATVLPSSLISLIVPVDFALIFLPSPIMTNVFVTGCLFSRMSS